jgi:hypothetical protein
LKGKGDKVALYYENFAGIEKNLLSMICDWQVILLELF